ncbi:hypothetical protein [Nakamurella endophytica]|uniref:Uncharacterized protein n=1 Tax=Nakamurella endophytica TaxID=1748367 RepID=A0A917SN10_9ACTN|nr:hypothetical protein [Nakamurella endophytica]GGL87365.1 hypothetical protein GCM10011594_03680 [Nakamurella endophytica]
MESGRTGADGVRRGGAFVVDRRTALRSAAVFGVSAGLAVLGAESARAVTGVTTTAFTRPTGTGIYAYENLGVSGNNLVAAMNAAMSRARSQGISKPTLTLPAGVFETHGFGQSANNCGFLVPQNLSIVGSGPSTVLRVAENSLTSAQASVPLKLMILPKGSGVLLSQFTLQGLPQRGKIYEGINVYGCSSPVLRDIKVTGVPGNFNSPPGETFGININGGSGAKLYRVEVDGRDGSGKKVGACGIGVNNSSGVELHDCYTHHMGFSHGVSLWQSTGVTTWNHRSEYNGTALNAGGSYGSLGCGINHEKSTNTTHYSVRLGNNTHSELRYYAVPYKSTDPHSGDTRGHRVSTLTLTDTDGFRVRIDNTQSTLPALSSAPTPHYYYT